MNISYYYLIGLGALILIFGAIYIKTFITFKLNKKKNVTLFLLHPEIPFLGSLLQLLYNLEDFKAFIMAQKSGLLSLAMQGIFKVMQQDKDVFGELDEVVNVLKKYSLISPEIKVSFIDVHDLFKQLLMILEYEAVSNNEELRQISPDLHYKTITKDFQTKWCVQYQCNACNTCQKIDISIHNSYYENVDDLYNQNIKGIKAPGMILCPQCGNIDSKSISKKIIEYPKFVVAQFPAKTYQVKQGEDEDLQKYEMKLDSKLYGYKGHIEDVVENSYNQFFAANVNRNNEFLLIGEILLFNNYKDFFSKKSDLRFVEMAIFEKVTNDIL